MAHILILGQIDCLQGAGTTGTGALETLRTSVTAADTFIANAERTDPAVAPVTAKLEQIEAAIVSGYTCTMLNTLRQELDQLM